MAKRPKRLALRIDWELVDEGSVHRLTLVNSALNHREGSHGDLAQARIRLSRRRLVEIVVGGAELSQALAQGMIDVEETPRRSRPCSTCSIVSRRCSTSSST
ncbi:MAG: alkyl sulfatase C-terminal domain-containing protein [Burkholderiaceae bacterium]